MFPIQRHCLICLLLLIFPMGCGLHKSPHLVDQALKKQNLREDRARAGLAYQVRSPDLLEIYVPDHEMLTGRFRIHNDGRLHFPTGEELWVEGKTPVKIRRELARRTRVDLDQVRVRVLEHKSQQLYVYGEVKGQTRVVDYRGPETVVSLIQRMGGLSRGAAPSDLQIVRAQVADGERPVVFDVDLEQMLLDDDNSAIPRLMPFDQIYVGESRRSFLEKSLPRWLRPIYARLVGLPRNENRKEDWKQRERNRAGMKRIAELRQQN